MINPIASNRISVALPQRIRTLLKTMGDRRKQPSSSSKSAVTIIDAKPTLLTLREAPLSGRDDVVCLEIAGVLNRHTYLRLIETACKHHSQGRRALLLDLRQVSKIELSGFFALLSIARLYSGQPLLDPESGWDGLRQAMEEITPMLAEQVKLVAPSPPVAQRLASSTIGQFWEQYPDRESALASLPPTSAPSHPGRRTGIASVLLALYLLVLLFISLSGAPSLLAAPLEALSQPAPFMTHELSTTYLITGHVHAVGNFPMDGAVIYVGDQYSTTLDPAGTYTLTHVVSGTYEIRGELSSPSPCVFYLFQPISRSVQIPPDAIAQNFDLFYGHADPAPVSGRVTDSNGAPIAGVAILGIGVESYSDGTFESAWPSGCDTYTLIPQKPGFTFVPPTITVTQPMVSGIYFIGTDHWNHIYLPIVTRSS